jgi:hypothetical protein
MQNKNLLAFLRFAAISGNIVFVLWIWYNAMDEGFRGTLPEKASFIGLTGLLALNCYLVLSGKKQNQFMDQQKES